MAVIVDFGIPQEQLALHELFSGYPEARLEFEPTVSGASPRGGRLFWVSGIDRDEIVEQMETVELIESITPLLDRNGSCLCEVVIGTEVEPLWTALRNNDAYLLEAVGTADGWRLTVLFPDRRNISPFMEYMSDLEVDIDTRRIDTSPFPEDDGAPSEFQADALEVALEKGYWNVPRQASLQTIADELGISDQAASERIRRGVRTLVSKQVKDGA